METIWTLHRKTPLFSALEGRQSAEVAIIGGGLAGILTAHLLRQEGISAVVLEADHIGGGQTMGTTAKLTAQHGLIYRTLWDTVSPEAAGQYARANLTAVKQLRQLVREQNISCDFQDCATFLYATGAPGPLQQEYETCRKLGMDVFLTRDSELPFSALALGLREQALFHPLKLLDALSAELQIFEQSRVLKAEGNTLHLQRGTVTADHIVFACHYPFVNFPGLYFLRQHQERSYVLALEGTGTMHNAYLGIDGEKLSFRPCGDLLLLGGGAYRTGENPRGGKYTKLENAAKRYWPQCRIVSRWSAQDCIPLDGIPLIGRFSAGRPHWLVATGFQKWGMSSSMVAADLLRNLIVGKDPSPDHAVFSPQRFHGKASAKQLLDDTGHTLRGLTRRFLSSSQISAATLPPGHGGIVELDGETLGVYRDESGELHAVSVACPHLGCRLEWNPDEKSWDCPCHGSRFDVDGRLLDGPAQTDLKTHGPASAK